VCVGLNPSRVVIGSNVALPIMGTSVAGVSSHAVAAETDELEMAHNTLWEYAKPLCKKANETELLAL